MTSFLKYSAYNEAIYFVSEIFNINIEYIKPAKPNFGHLFINLSLLSKQKTDFILNNTINPNFKSITVLNNFCNISFSQNYLESLLQKNVENNNLSIDSLNFDMPEDYWFSDINYAILKLNNILVNKNNNLISETSLIWQLFLLINKSKPESEIIDFSKKILKFKLSYNLAFSIYCFLNNFVKTLVY